MKNYKKAALAAVFFLTVFFHNNFIKEKNGGRVHL